MRSAQEIKHYRRTSAADGGECCRTCQRKSLKRRAAHLPAAERVGWWCAAVGWLELGSICDDHLPQP